MDRQVSLEDLREQIKTLEYTELERQRLETLRDELTQKLKELDKRRYHERADVQRLEKPGLANTIYRLSGKWEERLERERKDVDTAEKAYQKAASELASIDARLESIKQDVLQLQTLKHTFEKRLQDKTEYLRNTGTAESMELVCREKVISDYSRRLRELDEADRAGRHAVQAANEALDCLDSADGYAAWDLLGGGMIADLAKHSRLDEAQACVERLQDYLSRFAKELGDVAVQLPTQVNVEGLLRIADYWFDNIFTDWTVKDRIERSIAEIKQVHTELEQVLRRLEAMRLDAQQGGIHAREELKNWVVKLSVKETEY